MPHLFLHGLGQGPESWKDTLACLELPEEPLCPNLFALLTQRPGRWEDLYAGFCRYADRAGTPLHLCGLPLGAVLALQYAIEHPQAVRSLVLAALARLAAGYMSGIPS